MEIGEQLSAIKTAGERYRKKHTGKKGAVVKGLLDDVETFRGQLPALLDRLAAPGDKEWPQDLSVNEAMAAERLGVTPDDLGFVSGAICRFDALNDSKETAPGVELGGSAINKPVLVTYGGTKRVWKEEEARGWRCHGEGRHRHHQPAARRQPQRRQRHGGLDARHQVMPEAGFGVHDGKVGLVMSAAPGRDLKKLKDELWKGQPRKSKADYVERAEPQGAGQPAAPADRARGLRHPDRPGRTGMTAITCWTCRAMRSACSC